MNYTTSIVLIVLRDIADKSTRILSLSRASFQTFSLNMVGSCGIICVLWVLLANVIPALLLYEAWGRFYKFTTYVSRQCRVKWIDVERRGGYYGGVWQTTVMDEDKPRDVFVYDGGLSRFESFSWEQARKYKV